jgi:hypothetical protein
MMVGSDDVYEAAREKVRVYFSTPRQPAVVL